ncbi:CA174 protein, partial [Indicator maculatus]|nr:CA174 protein [Indicator maculatus]
CSSRRAAGKRPPKRLKSEKPAPVKPELKPEELTGGGESLAALGEARKPSDGDQRPEDPGECSLIQQEKGESIPELKEDKQQKEQDAPPEPHTVKSSSAPAKLGRDEQLHIYSEEERSCQSLLSDESSLGDADVPRRLMELDSSALLNEDSNQPMPVAHFFGDLELLRDLPAAALPSTMMSRREFRKLHIIAKEEEEEEDVV